MTELSSLNSLAALARTHTAFQREAERALYRTLSIFPREDDTLRCLETLVANSEKAALVHSLAVECTRDNPDENWKAMTCLVKVLINMHSLSDFRLIMRPNITNFWFKARKKVINSLNKILWLVYEVLIFSKLTILLEIQWKPFSIENSLL